MDAVILSSHFHAVDVGASVGFALVEYRGQLLYVNALAYDTDQVCDDAHPEDVVPAYELHVLNPATESLATLAPVWSDEVGMNWLVQQADEDGLLDEVAEVVVD